MHSVEVFNSYKLFLEVIVKKFIVRTKRKDLLLLKLPCNQFVHLLLSQLAFLKQQLDLCDRICSAHIDLVFNHVQTSFKNTVNFVSPPYFDLLRLLLLFDVFDFLKLLFVL